MQSDAATPDEYVASLPSDWRRETLEAVRAMIRSAAPDLDESMHYRMLGYGLGDDFVLHLNAQKQYVSLYVGDAAMLDPDGTLLAGLDVGKGCVRLKRSNVVGDSNVDRIIARAIEQWREGVGSSC